MEKGSSIWKKLFGGARCVCPVFTTHSLEALGRVRETLAEHNIPHEVATTNRSNQSLGWGRGTSRTQFGSLGSNAAAEYCYEVLVEKAQREHARGVLGNKSSP